MKNYEILDICREVFEETANMKNLSIRTLVFVLFYVKVNERFFGLVAPVEQILQAVEI